MLTVLSPQLQERQLVALDWGAINAEEIVDLLFDVAMGSDKGATMIASTSTNRFNSKTALTVMSPQLQEGQLCFVGLGAVNAGEAVDLLLVAAMGSGEDATKLQLLSNKSVRRQRSRCCRLSCKRRGFIALDWGAIIAGEAVDLLLDAAMARARMRQ